MKVMNKPRAAGKMRSMDVRLQDIANELGVSVMTVSRSLRHDSTISPQTRARVHEAARRLGYKGRAGKTGSPIGSNTKTQTVGLLLRHESLEAAHRDNMLMRMMGGMMSVLDKHNLRLKTHTWPGSEWPHLDEDPSAIPPLLRESECQALIVQGYHAERNLDFLSHRLPVVSLGRRYRGLTIDTVLADNVDGVQMLVAHLAKLGHQRLAWLGGAVDWSFIEARQAGFMQGCIQHRLEINPHLIFGTEIWDGRDICDKAALLSAVDMGVTAFVCGNDYAAFKVIQELEASGKRVPEDVSVTGFDGILGEGNMRQTTSIDPGFFEIGKWAAELALRRLAGPQDEPCIVSVPGKLVPGHTVAPPRHLSA